MNEKLEKRISQASSGEIAIIRLLIDHLLTTDFKANKVNISDFEKEAKKYDYSCVDMDVVQEFLEMGVLKVAGGQFYKMNMTTLHDLCVLVTLWDWQLEKDLKKLTGHNVTLKTEARDANKTALKSRDQKFDSVIKQLKDKINALEEAKASLDEEHRILLERTQKLKGQVTTILNNSTGNYTSVDYDKITNVFNAFQGGAPQ